MALFRSDIQTATRAGIDADRWRPDMGCLKPGSGPTEYALVHGDREEVIEGNLRSQVKQNRILKTEKDYECEVTGDRCMTENNFTHCTRGNSQQTVIGATMIQRIGATTENYIQTKTENHCSPKNINEPTSWLEVKGFEACLTFFSADWTQFAVGFVTHGFDITITSMSATTVEAAAKAAVFEAVGYKAEAEGVETKARGVEAKAGAADLDTAADLSSVHVSANSRVM